MGLIVTTIADQKAAPTGIGKTTDDIRFGFTAHALHLDVFALKLTTGAATLQQLLDKCSTWNISTKNGANESTIDTDDLFDLMPEIGQDPYITPASTTDNDPMGYGLVMPFSPKPDKFTSVWGLGPNQGNQSSLDWSADVAGDYDNFVYDLTVEGISADLKPSSLGYLAFQKDEYTTGAVGSKHETDVQGTRLLAASTFMTTSYEDLAAAASFNVQTVREQSVRFSNEIKLGPYKPSRSWSMRRAAGSNVIDNARMFSNYGINNDGAELGLNINNRLVDIQTTAGVSSETARVTALVMRSNA